ncbi:MAG: hypothetical protein O3C29_04870 [Proteobacteria bacterium]|nr:hypothetical protein [Pseudomonadota bacterium]MDA1290683.1 hypothetical protein [Pseudomonadota bacterium]
MSDGLNSYSRFLHEIFGQANDIDPQALDPAVHRWWRQSVCGVLHMKYAALKQSLDENISIYYRTASAGLRV